MSLGFLPILKLFISSDVDTEAVIPGLVGSLVIDSEGVTSSAPEKFLDKSNAAASDIVTGVGSTSSSEGSKSIKSVNTFTRDSTAVTESVLTISTSNLSIASETIGESDGFLPIFNTED